MRNGGRRGRGGKGAEGECGGERQGERAHARAEAAERAQHDFIATIEKECPRAFGASAVGSELPDMTYLRAMLDLDWWRRPNARAVETFYAGLARGCAVPGYQRW